MLLGNEYLADFEMAMTQVPKADAPKRVLERLEKALQAALMKNCGVNDEHKRAMRLYLNSWVAEPIKEALLDLKRIRRIEKIKYR